jgi:hypothetical protein
MMVYSVMAARYHKNAIPNKKCASNQAKMLRRWGVEA